ncbi:MULTISPECIES: hypothetical protein [Mameliella]|jgi:ActR/RegA family two-component response regulator|uniref:hypothetical protein n=1 Tax=Mameliella TaxID=1434019 RepID=UPI000840FF34|nr:MULTISPECIES: hypothetical protein [Mameliella]MBV6636889.1 hypothetical protein [Mameliella sp.]MCR9272804.1 hypothetical protein [Paracoccaceae bacterium]ODM47174.1 hypothetical protein A9320_24140 [Ruegeria sp. PBVC088]MBY6121750.1 hypothetical protein [Mameliella alba]MDD9728506.1 hypothetical protein [Mameliella sp. AT18]
MTGETTGTRTAGPTLIVEDNAFLSTELFEALQEAGLNPLPPVSHYTAALSSLSQDTPRLCVLDLDLGRQMSSNVVIGEEGRRLLAILHARGCRTAVYSAYVSNPLGLRDIAPDVEVLSKSQPVEELVRVLRNLSGLEPAPA